MFRRKACQRECSRHINTTLVLHVFSFLVVLGFYFRDLCLPYVLPLEPHAQLFCYFYVSGRVSHFAQVSLDHNPATCASHWDCRGVPLYLVYWLRWGFNNFFVQTGLKPQSSQSLPRKWLKLKACTTNTQF
jgi:hypothetical protein